MERGAVRLTASSSPCWTRPTTWLTSDSCRLSRRSSTRRRRAASACSSPQRSTGGRQARHALPERPGDSRVASANSPVELATTASFMPASTRSDRAGWPAVPAHAVLRAYQARRRPSRPPAQRAGAPAAAIHGNLNQNQRQRAGRLHAGHLGCWWLPTWPRAGSTSTTSISSCTSTRRTTRRTTCTAPVVRRAQVPADRRRPGRARPGASDGKPAQRGRGHPGESPGGFGTRAVVEVATSVSPSAAAPGCRSPVHLCGSGRPPAPRWLPVAGTAAAYGSRAPAVVAAGQPGGS